MTIETLILATVLALAIWTVRSHGRLIAGVWHESKWWEKLLLCLALLPVPGPLEEVVGVLVIRRVIRRRG